MLRWQRLRWTWLNYYYCITNGDDDILKLPSQPYLWHWFWPPFLSTFPLLGLKVLTWHPEANQRSLSTWSQCHQRPTLKSMALLRSPRISQETCLSWCYETYASVLSLCSWAILMPVCSRDWRTCYWLSSMPTLAGQTPALGVDTLVNEPSIAMSVW